MSLEHVMVPENNKVLLKRSGVGRLGDFLKEHRYQLGRISRIPKKEILMAEAGAK